MVKIVNSTEGKRIRELAEIRQMLSDNYLFDKKILQTKFLFDQFFLNDERMKLLNISFSLPSMVTSIFSDFTGEPQTNFEFETEETVASIVWGGYAVHVIRLIDGEIKIENFSPEGYIQNDDGSQVLITFINVENANNEIKRYALEQKYDKGILTNKLFLLKQDGSPTGIDYAIYGEEVALNTIEPTRNLQGQENLQTNGINPVVVINNSMVGQEKYGLSEIKKVRSIISSIETQIVNIQDQLLKHLASILAIPSAKLPVDKDGYVDMKRLQIIMMEANETPPIYVSNTNPLMEKSFDFIEKLILQLGAVLSVPVEFFNMHGSGGVESAEAKNVRLAPFLKKIMRFRRKTEKAVLEINEIAKLWGKGEEKISFIWPEIFPVSKIEEVNEVGSAIDYGLLSRLKGIMKYQNLTEEEAMVELEKINAERTAVDPTQLMN